ncbi:transposase-like zinc-binding domain-containing protein [Cylindrospermopsis raciborskii]
MKCPKCGSEHIRKNGIKKGKQVSAGEIMKGVKGDLA